MWNEIDEFASKIEIHYKSQRSEQPKPLTRELVIALAGAYRHVLQPQGASVQITYAEETAPISGSIRPRERLTILRNDLLQDRFTHVVGTIESVKFIGCIKIPDSGLCCSASFAFSAEQMYHESAEDRLARVFGLERNGGPFPSVIRNLRSMLSPCKLKAEYE